MVFEGYNTNASNGRVVIDLCEGEGDIIIDQLDVEVNDDIDFDVRGRIEDIDDDVLDDLIGHSLKPAEIHFCIQENAD